MALETTKADDSVSARGHVNVYVSCGMRGIYNVHHVHHVDVLGLNSGHFKSTITPPPATHALRNMDMPLSRVRGGSLNTGCWPRPAV